MLTKKSDLTITEASKSQSKRMSLTFKSTLVAVIAIFGILAVLAKQTPYFGIDLSITLFIQSIQNPVLDFYLQALTIIGNPECAITLVIILFVILLSFGKSFYALFFLFTVGSLQTIVFLIKFLVSRPRPNPELVNQVNLYFHDDSFPSGHVTFYIGCFGFLAFLAFTKIQSKILKNIILAICIVLISTIGISRIYVGAHWFSDTLGAYLIGSVWLYIMIHLFQKNRRNT